MNSQRLPFFDGTSSTKTFSPQWRHRWAQSQRAFWSFFCLAVALGNAASSISVVPGSVTLNAGQSQQFTASLQGGNPKGLTWSVNNIQGGNSAVGIISVNGAYTAPSVSSQTIVTVTVNAPSIGRSASATVTINPVVNISLSPASATLAPAQSQQLSAVVTGTTTTSVTWALSPAVGSISSSGVYTAPSSVPSKTTVGITATSMADNTKTATANLTVMSSVSIAVSPFSTTVASGQSQQFTAAVSGTTNTAVTWSVNPAIGTISSTGLYQAPSSIPSQQTIIVTAVSAADPTKSAGASLTVTPGSSLSISMSPTSATLGASQTQQFTASVSGATNTAVTWSLSSPVGTISPSGLYTAPSSITAPQSVNVTAASAADSTKIASATITLTTPGLTVTTTSLPAGITGTAYNTTLTANGGISPYIWSLNSGQLPPGVAFNTSGTLFGTPTGSGTYTMTVQATDSTGKQAVAALTLTIALCTGCSGPVSITTTTLPNATLGVSYSATLTGTGGSAPYLWSVSSGALPSGIALASSGVLSGIPTTGGAYSFTIGMSDSASPANTASKTVAFTVIAIDSYGGRMDVPCAGGPQSRFYTAQIGSSMRLCTPAGNAMWGQGVYVAGPQGNFVAKYGSDTNAYEQTLARIKAWGFNFLHTSSNEYEYPWNRTIKMPVVVYVRPGYYGMHASSRPNDPFPPGTLNQNIKNVLNGLSASFTGYIAGANGVPDWADLNRMNTSLNYIMTQTQTTDPLGLAPAIQNNKNLDYLIGVAVEDSDQTWGFFTSGQNDPFDTQPSGYGAPHGGYLSATMSPQQQADPVQNSFYNTDQVVYTKKAWHDYLASKYGTIAALNTAWNTGGAYTTFDSTSIAVTGESVGTTDGTNFAFSHTLANSGAIVPNSIQVYEDGVMIAGDCFHPNRGDVCNPAGGTASGGIWGQTASGGNINYSTKALSVSFTSAYQYLNSISCSTSGTPSCTGVFADYFDIGAAVNDHVTTIGSSCCNSKTETVTSKSADVGGFYTYTWTNTAGRTGTETWSGGARDQVAKIMPPTAGHVLTVNYQVNGWSSGGTGIMDEDGRSSHNWMGTDAYALTNANSNVAADLRAFLYQLSHNYFASMRTGVRAAFTNAGVAPPMYLGPDAFGTWTSTPRKEVLQAAADTIDIAIMGGAAGYTLTQPMLDYMAQWYGKPFLDGVFLHANADSPFASNVMANDYGTQSARGAAYQSTVQSYLSSRTSAGVNFRLGFGWWQYGDNPSENTNWGLVTLKDNAYDGNEAVTSTVTCSVPLNAFLCGGEAGNYGDAITFIRAANTLWRTQ